MVVGKVDGNVLGDKDGDDDINETQHKEYTSI